MAGWLAFSITARTGLHDKVGVPLVAHPFPNCHQ